MEIKKKRGYLSSVWGSQSFKNRNGGTERDIEGWLQMWEMSIKNDFAFYGKKRSGEKMVMSECFLF